MKVFRIHRCGGPEAMMLDDLPTPEPPPGHVLVQVKAAGVNFFDTQLRSGLYKRELPIALGIEGAGVVERSSVDAGGVKPGDRVAWIMVPGSYATHVVVPVSRIVALPDAVSFSAAAAAIYQGMTAHYLSHSSFALKPGHTCVVHSAAGGVGSLLCQMAKIRGARVIGTVSSEVKVAAAREAGADHVIVYTKGNFAAEVKQVAGGANVVYDAVGRDTFASSLASLVPRGFLVIYGEASGPVPPVDVHTLLDQGSVYLTRTGLIHYLAGPDEFQRRSQDVLRWVASGAIRQRVERVFPLGAAADAHHLLESRGTTGKLLLLPEAAN